MNLFSSSPTFVIVPVTSYVAPSPFAKPSPPTVTVSFVSALPSYGFESLAEVSVTALFAITSVPSSITNSTFVKLTLLFVKSAGFSSML